MTVYRVHQPLPLGVPSTFATTARVWVDSQSPGAAGPLVVECPDARFAEAVRARLRTCYGFRGRMLGDTVTQDDLHCAMALGVMQALRPVRVGVRGRGRR